MVRVANQHVTSAEVNVQRRICTGPFSQMRNWPMEWNCRSGQRWTCNRQESTQFNLFRSSYSVPSSSSYNTVKRQLNSTPWNPLRHCPLRQFIHPRLTSLLTSTNLVKSDFA